jgi:hypothetical protein
MYLNFPGVGCCSLLLAGCCIPWLTEVTNDDQSNSQKTKCGSCGTLRNLSVLLNKFFSFLPAVTGLPDWVAIYVQISTISLDFLTQHVLMSKVSSPLKANNQLILLDVSLSCIKNSITAV